LTLALAVACGAGFDPLQKSGGTIKQPLEKDNQDTSTTSAPGLVQQSAAANLAPTSRTEKRNVVLVHLEATRAQSVTPYNSEIKTTPFLDELAKSSLLAEHAYTIVPHTFKASVSVNCGIEPDLAQENAEAKPGGIPVPCLARLLKDQGYDTVFFQSSTEDFDDFAGLVKNFGYDTYYSLESMSTDGLQKVNSVSYEDDIMLKPSEDWLRDHEEKAFVAEYRTGAGYHDYQCVPNRYGDENFSEDNQLNSYLNCLRYQDFFVKNLMDQYKKLGLYDNTIFVIFGDHGEGFGEHDRYQHDDTIYEEGLKVPLIIHAPGWFSNGERVKGLSNHTDIVPTVLEMLGYEVKNGGYPGYSLLHPLPEDRTLMFSCFHKNKCLASIKGSLKYIYHYGEQPDELFDLSKDPLEKRNLANEDVKQVTISSYSALR
jgi:phosphoglycerol transferase MdoB-like AlkP superfamily enzyme